MNITILLFVSGLCGVCIGILFYWLFSGDNHDYEGDFYDNCSKSRHLFPLKSTPEGTVYCFCGNESMDLDALHHYLIVKK